MKNILVAGAAALAVLSLSFSVHSRPALAQAAAPPCLPGGVCCTSVGMVQDGPYRWHSDNRCGTLEQFQRYAKITCLRAEAMENASSAQNIEASGRCSSAQIAASKVADAQRMNAANHQRAMEARRQLQEMGVTP